MIVVPTEADHNFSYVFVVTIHLPHELFLYIFLYFCFLCYSVNKDLVDVFMIIFSLKDEPTVLQLLSQYFITLEWVS